MPDFRTIRQTVVPSRSAVLAPLQIDESHHAQDSSSLVERDDHLFKKKRVIVPCNIAMARGKRMNLWFTGIYFQSHLVPRWSLYLA